MTKKKGFNFSNETLFQLQDLRPFSFVAGWAVPKDVRANYQLELFELRESIVEMTVNTAAKLVSGSKTDTQTAFSEIYELKRLMWENIQTSLLLSSLKLQL